MICRATDSFGEAQKHSFLKFYTIKEIIIYNWSVNRVCACTEHLKYAGMRTMYSIQNIRDYRIHYSVYWTKQISIFFIAFVNMEIFARAITINFIQEWRRISLNFGNKEAKIICKYSSTYYYYGFIVSRSYVRFKILLINILMTFLSLFSVFMTTRKFLSYNYLLKFVAFNKFWNI